jgi:hypothetical protein
MTPSSDAPKTKITQLEVASSQFDRAATLFMIERDYVSAVTLACASEGITGEYLKVRKVKTHVEELKEFVQSELAPTLSYKTISDNHINFARNFFKHKCEEHEQFEFDLEAEAIVALCRAADNLVMLTKLPSEKSVKFMQWLKVHRPDLIGNAETG